MNSFKTRHPKWHRALTVGHGVAQVASNAMSIASAIAGVINAEHKHVDTINNALQNNASPTIVCLTNIAQGNADTERSGNSILMKHIYLKACITRGSADSRMRLMLIRDMNDSAGTAPTIADILQNYSTTYSHLSAHQKTKTDRFRIIWDKTYSLNNVSSQEIVIKKFKEFKVKQYKKQNGKVKIKGEHCTYSGASSSNISKGHLYFVAIGSTDTATLPNLTYYARFGYVDN